MSEHDGVKDLLAAVALGAATPDEARRVETHAGTCAICREELDGLRAATAALAAEVPQREPRPELRDRVLAAARAEPRGAGEAPAAAPPPRRRRLPSLALGRPWVAVAAVLAAAVVALISWNVILQRGDREHVTDIALRGGPSAPGVRGQVLVLNERGTAVVRLSNLPPAGEGRAYELWAIRGGRPVSAGFMARSGAQGAVAATDDLEGVTALAVTPEPTGNTSAPTGPKVVVAPIPA